MSRLLFAAARSAQIEWYSKPHSKWCASAVVSFDNRPAQRIHPNDAHLQYGPISTALRERAEWGGETEAGILYIHGFFDFTGKEDDEFILGGEFNRSLFLLILAEALADEGL